MKSSNVTVNHDDVEELKTSYIAYLGLKFFNQLAEDVPIYGLISPTEMQQAKSSMAYIDNAFKKQHPDFDTEALWQQQMEEYEQASQENRIFFTGLHHPTDDMVLTKIGFLGILTEKEQYYRALNGDEKIIKKDF